MKTLEELMIGFRQMCDGQSCDLCKYGELDVKGDCGVAYAFEQLVEKHLDNETDTSSEPICQPWQNVSDALPKPTTADKMKAVQLPKLGKRSGGEGIYVPTELPAWVKVGQWVEFAWAKDDRPYKILGVRHKAVHICNMAYDEREVYYDYCKPVSFRPYTYEEAEQLLGKTLRYKLENVQFAALISIVSLDNKGSFFINGSSQSWLQEHDAMIDGVPIGVPVIDEEAMKGDEETVPCDTCKHSRWFGEYGMQVCEKRGKACTEGVCEDHEKKGGE